jgi:hypothetical protein
MENVPTPIDPDHPRPGLDEGVIGLQIGRLELGDLLHELRVRASH